MTPAGVGELAAGLDRARAGIDGLVGVIEEAVVREARLVGQAQVERDGVLSLPEIDPLPLAHQLPEHEQVALAHVHVSVDGVGPDDRGQHGGLAVAHEVPLVVAGPG